MALRDSLDQRIRSSLLIIGGLGNKVAGPGPGCGSGSSHDHCLTGAVKAGVSKASGPQPWTESLGTAPAFPGFVQSPAIESDQLHRPKGLHSMPSISSATGEAAAQQQGSSPSAAERPLPPMTRDRPFAWLLLITGVVGWLASGALVLEKLEVLKDPSHVTVCDVNPWISCGQVMQTWQSSVFGFPNMFIGHRGLRRHHHHGHGHARRRQIRPLVLAGPAGRRDPGLCVRGVALVPGAVLHPHPVPVLHGGLGCDDSAVRLGHASATCPTA